MRTPLIIITISIVLIAAAFFLRVTNTVGPDSFNAENRKEKKVKSKEKKNDKGTQKGKDDSKPDDNDTGSGIAILNKTNVPEVLKELSALCYIDANRFATVHDERGSVFIYNVATESIEKEIPFAGKGDYEGVAIVKGDAFVLRSDGMIFEIKNYSTRPAVVEHKTHLTAKHNTEGFCYDNKNNRLLIAIKGPETGNKQYKGIYAFNLSNRTLSSEPVYKIDLTDKVFADKGKKNSSGINPSAIAVNPNNGDIYITEATIPKLLILDKAGNIKSLQKLNPSDFNQPEGITFSPDGKIFISNEGSKEAGNILEVESI